MILRIKAPIFRILFSLYQILHKLFRLSVLVIDEIFSCISEIIKTVLLVEYHSTLMPFLAIFTVKIILLSYITLFVLAYKLKYFIFVKLSWCKLKNNNFCLLLWHSYQ